MARLLAHAIALAVFLSTSTLAAVTLAPVAGSTPQSSRLYCFFPKPIGVVVRDEAGAPATGVEVTFSAPFDSTVGIPDVGSVVTVRSDADGVAWVPSPGWMGLSDGSTVITAASAGASNEIHFRLLVKGKPATRIELLSGDGQVAQVGKEFSPWIVRALDEDSEPVPYTAVLYSAAQPGPGPAVMFEGGANILFVAADAHGVASSPKPTANETEGEASGVAQLNASALDQTVPGVFFTFTNSALASPAGARLVSAPPRSIAVGSTAALPFTVKLLDASGQAVNGAPVTFSTDGSCGAFGAARTFVTATNGDGVATSPEFAAKRPRVSCATSVAVGGQTLDLAMHVYDPRRVTATVTPPYINTQMDTFYRVEVSFTESGRPVQVPVFDVRALSRAGGASYLTTPLADIWENRARLDFVPNSKPGLYAVEFSQGDARVLIPVLQVP